MKKITIIGYFGENGVCQGGQSIKTVTLASELEKRFGDKNVLCCMTTGCKKDIFSAPCYVAKALFRSKNVIILPAKNGLRVFVPLLAIGNIFFHRKLHYCVIGGWLSEYLKKHRFVARKLKSFTGIYVETDTMKKALENDGYTNIFIMPNCKKLKILDSSKLVYQSNKPYKLCTFSRVMEEKGIADAVNTVIKINNAYGTTVFSLDIYGQIDPQQTKWFESLKNEFPNYINYGGLVPFDKSVDVIKNYFALLFPTKFYTEGIPGTVIDAYAAGVPVIASRWESFDDLIDNGVTGYGYTFDSVEEFENLLKEIAQNPEKIEKLKPNCLKKAQDYIPKNALGVLTQRL